MRSRPSLTRGEGGRAAGSAPESAPPRPTSSPTTSRRCVSIAKSDNLDRTRTLVSRGASAHSAQEDLEAQVAVLESAVGVAQADVHTPQSELHALEVNRGDFTIEAPLTGVIITDLVEMGEMLAPSQERMQITMYAAVSNCTRAPRPALPVGVGPRVDPEKEAGSAPL